MDDKIKRHGIVVLLFGLVLTACGNQMDKNITDYSSGETEAQAVKIEARDELGEQSAVGAAQKDGTTWECVQETEGQNAWANSFDCCIGYADGSYYYASNLHDLFLYRVNEDGSKSQRVASVSADALCLQDGMIYFIHTSGDGYESGIYRIHTDGSGMERLCGMGRRLRVSDGYIYFCAAYEAEYDLSGLVTVETPDYNDNFLYRMKKDGSGRELIATDVREYELRFDQDKNQMELYCSKYCHDGTMSVSRMSPDGKSEQVLWNIDYEGTMMLYKDRIYFLDIYFGSKIVRWYDLLDGMAGEFQVPLCYAYSCIYDDHFYGVCESLSDHKREISIFRVDLEGENDRILYEYSFDDASGKGGAITYLYATEKGVFFRPFVSEQRGVRWFRLTGNEEVEAWEAEEINEIAYSDEEIHVSYTDDLSLLDQMGQTDFRYAARDGRVYYRQYHEDSFVNGAESAYYRPTAGTDKEIVRIDANGEKTVLFSDKGYGDLYLIGDRFYMTEMITEKKEDTEETYSYIYSIDMQGQNRVDYGAGEIWAVDLDRKILVVTLFSEYTGEGAYCVLDGISGEMTPIIFNPAGEIYLLGYSDGWCYFEECWENDISRVVARSLGGEQREIITLDAGKETEYGHGDQICRMEIDGESISIVYGAYDYPGGRYFQGGKLITFKSGESDYQEIKTNSDDYFLCHDAGRLRVYFKDCAEIGFSGKASVWDLETNTIFPSDFPPELIQEAQCLYGFPFCCQEQLERSVLCEWNGDIYALLVDSGTIVRVAEQIDSDIEQSGGGAADEVSYDHMYYADGYLYFEVTFSICDQEYATRWGDGFRRLQTDMYRRNLEDGTMELLNTY